MHLKDVKHVASWLNGFILEDEKQVSTGASSPFPANLAISERILLQFDDKKNILTINGFLPLMRSVHFKSSRLVAYFFF